MYVCMYYITLVCQDDILNYYLGQIWHKYRKLELKSIFILMVLLIKVYK